ncbi:MAG: hypothetical protein V3T59_02765 [Desulfobacterales bacterium]
MMRPLQISADFETALFEGLMVKQHSCDLIFIGTKKKRLASKFYLP